MVGFSLLIVLGIVVVGAVAIAGGRRIAKRIEHGIALRRRMRAELRAAYELLRAMEELGLDVEHAFTRQREVVELERLYNAPAARQRALSR